MTHNYPPMTVWSSKPMETQLQERCPKCKKLWERHSPRFELVDDCPLEKGGWDKCHYSTSAMRKEKE